MKTYNFTVILSGVGDDPDKAWEDAVEAFQADPGSTPITYNEESDERE